MKIVMICEFYNESLGYQENLLTKYYTKHGHTVTVITSTFDSIFDYYANRYDKKALSRVYFDHGTKIIKLKYSFNLLNKLRKFTNITKILEQEKPDLIFLHDIMLNMVQAANYVKKNPATKIIMDYHADYSNSAKNWLSLHILHKIIRKKFYFDRGKKYISKIFPIVPASTKFLHEVYDVPYNDMELLPLGADTDLGKEINRKNEGVKIRERLNIFKEEIVIFSGGKLQPTKKTELLIQAFLSIDYKNLHLVVIGEANETDNQYKEVLLKLADNNSRIHFIGWLKSEEIYKYLDASDIAVFPASQSIIWQQAISMGLPLIVGDIGDQSAAYLNEFNNIVILEKKDIRSEVIAININRIINNKTLFENMKLGAIKITDMHLNWDNLIYKTLRFNAN